MFGVLKITPKKPPRKKPPQSSAMVKVEELEKTVTVPPGNVAVDSSRLHAADG